VAITNYCENGYLKTLVEKFWGWGLGDWLAVPNLFGILKSALELSISV